MAHAQSAFKLLQKEFFDSNFYMLLTLKKRKFLKDSRCVREDGWVDSFGGLLRDIWGTIWSYHSDLHLCTAHEAELWALFHEVNRFDDTYLRWQPSPTLWQWVHIWDCIEMCLRGREIQFVHIHRERNGSADALARGIAV
ncbi:hypothetical protein AMTRI_Chr03g143220 [Amborella trichopoda]